jgi:glycine cleavage system H protein
VQRCIFILVEEIIMPEFLETTVDKFTFKVATDRFYTREGVWALAEGNRVRIGLSDFLQQRSGDIAFAEVKPVSTALAIGDEVAAIETIKVNIALGAPVSGAAARGESAMDLTPEAINQARMARAGWRSSAQPTGKPIERAARSAGVF